VSILIADIGANHCGDRKLMEKMVKTAAKIGIDVCKFQSWRADKLRKDWPDYENAYKYYKERELSEDDHVFLMETCEKHGIEFLTTVFDLDTVDFLASLGLRRIKIASPDANSWRLIDKCMVNFDHVIISLGMHTPEEVGQLAEFLGDRRDRVTVMHCVSLYPTPPDKLNMIRLAALMQVFPSVGFSDHTLGTDAGKLALCLGVSALEKHFTLDRHLPGKDQEMSALPREFKELVEWREKVRQMMYNPGNHDLGARKYIGRWGENA